MASGSINSFNVSDSEEEAEPQKQDERSPEDEAPPGRSPGPFSPQTELEPGTLLLSTNRISPSADGAQALAVSASAGLGGGGSEPRVSVDAIAAQLLRDQYILTALELHTELLEAGRELPRLRDYFSNPGNFERQSGTPPAGKELGLGPGGTLNSLKSQESPCAGHSGSRSLKSQPEPAEQPKEPESPARPKKSEATGRPKKTEAAIHPSDSSSTSRSCDYPMEPPLNDSTVELEGWLGRCWPATARIWSCSLKLPEPRTR